MKKIYTLASVLSLCMSMTAQNQFNIDKPNTNKIISNPHKNKKSMSINSVASGPGHISGSVFAANVASAKGFTQGTEYDFFINPIYMDSTVISSSTSGNEYVSNIKAGSVFDPKSVFWDGSAPLLAVNDSYTVDSLWIGALYKQVKFSVTDTLVVEIAWGLPSNASVFQALTVSSQTPALQFRTPKVTPSTSQGFTSFLSAPSTNYKKFKIALTSADTIDGVNYNNNNGYIIVPNVNQLVPAGNIFLASYSYKPGSIVPAGSVIKQYTGGAAQTENGLTGVLYSDPATTSNYYFYDNTSYSTAFDYIKKQRYGMFSGGQAFLNSCALPNYDGGWDIGFSVTYVSSVGMNELEADGTASLGQNVPNPFTSESMVSYQLTKDASNASFTVTDVMGRVISSEKVASNTGKHSVKLGSYAAGVYYYTLTVDGKSASKKMIVQ